MSDVSLEYLRPWLTEKVTKRQARAVLLPDGIEDDCTRNLLRRAWLELVSNICEGDELWYFRSADWTWRALCGREGYAVVRGDKIVFETLIRMS